ncbi:MAG: hypothetical protein R2834_09200 [Rhodothermales bacterium]
MQDRPAPFDPTHRVESPVFPAAARSMGWYALWRSPLLIVLIFAGVAQACRGQAVAPAPPVETQAVSQAPIDFSALIDRLSEESGYFDTDNLISNETSYLHVLGAMRRMGIEGGAYIGVGPGQNFSYIAHQRPNIALILDIRRDNLLMHLFYKALFTLAPDRATFLAIHFGRAVPQAPPTDLEALLDVIEALPRDEDVEAQRVRQVLDEVRSFGVPLDEASLATIERFHRQFISAGLRLQFNSHNRAPRAYYPTYRQLMLERDLDGNRAHYLAREEDYAYLRQMQLENRIVPVVGNFAGEHALREIGAYLRERGETVRVFYTSNVEFYLSYDGLFGKYIENVRSLPTDDNSVFIRSLFNRFSYNHPQSVPGHISTQIMQPVRKALASYDAGELRSYNDLVFLHVIDL